MLPLEQTHGRCRLTNPRVRRIGRGDAPLSPAVPTPEALLLPPFAQSGFTMCEVSGADGRVLAVSPGEGRRVTLTDRPDAADRVLACIPGGAAQTAFLMLPGGATFGIEGDGFAGPLVSFRLRQVQDAPLYELFHPIARHRRIGVLPDRNSALPFGVVFDRVGDPATDWFSLAPLPPDCLDAGGAALLEEVDAVIGPPLDANRLVDALSGGTLRLTLAEALIRLLPADQLQAVAQKLMDSPETLALLQSAMPLDPWVQEALPALIAWRDAGRPRTACVTSPAAETHVAIPHSGELRPQAGLVLQSLARRTIAPRRTAAFVATVKDEGPYLLDWIAYHRAIGFEHAVIYSNDNSDGSDALLDQLARHGIITWVRNELAPGALPQVKAYGHAFKRLPDLLDYRWVMVIDADEYVGLNAGMFRTVQDFIAWQEHQRVDAVALRWLTFGAGADDVWSDSSSTQRFIRRDPSISLSFKTLCRSNLFADSHAHFPYPAADDAFVFRWEDGAACYHMAKLEACTFEEPRPTASLAWVAHYFLRSAAEMLLKLGRGDAWYHGWEEESQNRPNRLIEQFVRLASDDLVEDRRMLAFSEAHRAEYARLAALPGMSACCEHVREAFVHRLALARQAAAAFDAGPDMPSFYGDFFRMLQAQKE
jgi:hypothetical protein